MSQSGTAGVRCGNLFVNNNEPLVANLASISLTTYSSGFQTAGAETSNLGVGTEGQIKVLYMHTHVGDMVVTVTNPGWGGSGTITFSAQGQSCMLQYLDSKWFAISANGVSFA